VKSKFEIDTNDDGTIGNHMGTYEANIKRGGGGDILLN